MTHVTPCNPVAQQNPSLTGPTATKGGAAPIFLSPRPDLLPGPPLHTATDPPAPRWRGSGPRSGPPRRGACVRLRVAAPRGLHGFFNRDASLAHWRG